MGECIGEISRAGYGRDAVLMATRGTGSVFVYNQRQWGNMKRGRRKLGRRSMVEIGGIKDLVVYGEWRGSVVYKAG